MINFTDDQLQGLYDSLGITLENEKDVRFEALHVRGTEEMSTTDLFEYFGKALSTLICKFTICLSSCSR